MDVFECRVQCKRETAVVRIHPGKLSGTEEERKVLFEDATRKYLKAVLAAKKKQNKKSAEA